MSIVQKVREWLSGCPYLDAFTGGQHIDWTNPTAGNYGVMPTGCSDVGIAEDIMGGVIKYKQYNLSMYARNWTVDDVVRLENTEFLDRFQDWVDDQQFGGHTPKFGDDPDTEVISAQNGMLFELSPDGQTGLYQVQITISYEKHYEKG